MVKKVALLKHFKLFELASIPHDLVQLA